MRTSSWTNLASAALLALASACTTEGSAREAAPPVRPANVVTVIARDYAFEAPASIPAGPTTLRLVNRGPELHHLQLVRIEEGHTFQELAAMDVEAGPPPAWIRFVGGPNAPVPGAETVATVNLEPGNYAILCFIPSPDGVLHMMKGMARPLTVTPTEASFTAAAEPAARITLRDFSYEIQGEIAAGRRTIRVDNEAAQPHELIVVRLAPGKTALQMASWIVRMDGPPPGAPIGGTSFLAQGVSNDVTIDFTPGDYALLCMVPDAGDGKPHVMHGMVRQITVREN
ncbi:MAG TPA: hypothetical protein VF613_03650 [Longimicrobium sp.]|jgi:hypothetical protein